MRVLNICFHGIGVPGRRLERGEDAYWVRSDRFREILDVVAGRPEVRLSFDDANASDVEIALPELRARELVATFFVVAGRIDHSGSLTTADVRALSAAGMNVGNHGMTHRPWRGLDIVQQQAELVEARRVISGLIGEPVLDAALPLGRYDRRLLARLRRLGYRSVHTSDRRWAVEGQWLQPRYSVRSGDTAEWVGCELLHLPSNAATVKGALLSTAKRWR